MKINIQYNETNHPWGGANQFLNYLKKELIKKRIYTNKIESADIILFNSFEKINDLIILKNLYPKKKFVQRMDGLTQLYNNPFDKRDLLSFFLNKQIACATIFQSNWSKKKNIEKGNIKKKFQIVISNSADKKVFFKTKKKKNKKINIISVSWSDNLNKGFKTIKWLDKNLNFNKFNYTFIGNSPIKFKNIKMLKPIDSKTLNKKLNSNDIFISPSKNEACSNAIIEAKECGLVTFVLNHGGNPEIVKNKKLLFKNNIDLFNKLNNFKIQNYKIKNTSKKTIESYISFFEKIHARRINNTRFNNFKFLKLKLLQLLVFLLSFLSRIYNLIKKYFT